MPQRALVKVTHEKQKIPKILDKYLKLDQRLKPFARSKRMPEYQDVHATT